MLFSCPESREVVLLLTLSRKMSFWLCDQKYLREEPTQLEATQKVYVRASYFPAQTCLALVFC